MVVFVRHGESRENRIENEQVALHGPIVGAARANFLMAQYADRGNPPLTLRGISQVETTGAWLRRHYGVFDVRFVSTLQRTHQTMNALIPHAAHVISALLDEFTLHGCGGDCGTEREVLPRNEWEADISRVHQFIDELCSGSYAGKRVLIAGHGNWIAAARRHPHPSIITTADGELNPVENASITTFRKRGSQFLLDGTMIVP